MPLFKAMVMETNTTLQTAFAHVFVTHATAASVSDVETDAAITRQD